MTAIDDDNPFSMTAEERLTFTRRLLAIQESYEGKIMELSVLKELGVVLQSLDIYDRHMLWLRFFKIIENYTSIDDISLLLRNPETDKLEPESQSGASDTPVHLKTAEELNTRMKQVLATSQPEIVTTDSGDAPEEIPESILLMPVTANKNVIGVLILKSRRQETFDKNQVRFFSLVADQISTALTIFNLYEKMLAEEKQRMLLSRFFSKTVTQTILGSKTTLRPGGERKHATVLFADLTGFTTMSEGIDPELVVDILNNYFTLMTPVIFKHNGTLDKIMGDCMLALFGVPISHGKDSIHAVNTAIEMINTLKNHTRSGKRSIPESLEVSIGINSGEVIAGYVGSESHLNYTVIGDVVNVAQRIQTLSGGNEILISQSVRDDIIRDADELDGLKDIIELPPQRVKGKEKAITVFKLVI